MIEDLEDFLINRIGDEATHHLMDCYYLLDQIGYENHIFPTQFALNDSEEIEGYKVVSSIQSIINDNYRLILKSMGIQISEEDISSTMLYQLLYAIPQIETYEDKERFICIIETSTTAEEALVDIANLLGVEHPESVLMHIQSVSSDFMEQVKNIASNELSTQDKSVYVDKSIIKERAKRFFSRVADTYIRSIVSEGTPIGLPADIYMNMLEEHFAYFDPTVDQMTKEILAGIVISDHEELQTLPAKAKSYTEKFTMEGLDMITINSAIDKLFAEVLA